MEAQTAEFAKPGVDWTLGLRLELMHKVLVSSWQRPLDFHLRSKMFNSAQANGRDWVKEQFASNHGKGPQNRILVSETEQLKQQVGFSTWSVCSLMALFLRSSGEMMMRLSFRL